MAEAEKIEWVVREAVGKALRTTVDDWPADRPLSEVPDGLFDSLAKLETVGLIERALATGPLAMDDAVTEFGTIASITSWVAGRT